MKQITLTQHHYVNFVETFIDADQTEVAEIRIDPITQYRSLFTKKAFKANEVIIGFMAKAEHKTPNYLTVQIADDRHIELFPECLECANHSCDPNCFFDTTRMEFVTLRAIAKGEELKFFYPSAEWNMDQPFPCNCGSSYCVGMIKGAKYLSKEEQRRYRFTDFIQQKLGN